MTSSGSPSTRPSADCNCSGGIVGSRPNRSASPPRASLDRNSPARNAEGTATSEQAAIHSSTIDRLSAEQVDDQQCGEQQQAHRAGHAGQHRPPAGSRTPGASARRSRPTVVTETARNTARCSRSIAVESSAFGVTSSRLPSSSVKARKSGASSRISSRTAPVSTLSILVRSRPPVRKVSSSGTKNNTHRSGSRYAAVSATGESSWASSGEAKKANPVAVISRPL